MWKFKEKIQEFWHYINPKFWQDPSDNPIRYQLVSSGLNSWLTICSNEEEAKEESKKSCVLGHSCYFFWILGEETNIWNGGIYSIGNSYCQLNSLWFVQRLRWIDVGVLTMGIERTLSSTKRWSCTSNISLIEEFELIMSKFVIKN